VKSFFAGIWRCVVAITWPAWNTRLITGKRSRLLGSQSDCREGDAVNVSNRRMNWNSLSISERSFYPNSDSVPFPAIFHDGFTRVLKYLPALYWLEHDRDLKWRTMHPEWCPVLSDILVRPVFSGFHPKCEGPPLVCQVFPEFPPRRPIRYFSGYPRKYRNDNRYVGRDSTSLSDKPCIRQGRAFFLWGSPHCGVFPRSLCYRDISLRIEQNFSRSVKSRISPHLFTNPAILLLPWCRKYPRPLIFFILRDKIKIWTWLLAILQRWKKI